MAASENASQGPKYTTTFPQRPKEIKCLIKNASLLATTKVLRSFKNSRFRDKKQKIVNLAQKMDKFWKLQIGLQLLKKLSPNFPSNIQQI